MNIQGLKDALGHLDIEDNPAVLKKKSRDFYWFSPILKRELDEVMGDLIVSPKNEAQLTEAISIAYRMDTGHAAGRWHRKLWPGYASFRRSGSQSFGSKRYQQASAWEHRCGRRRDFC